MTESLQGEINEKVLEVRLLEARRRHLNVVTQVGIGECRADVASIITVVLIGILVIIFSLFTVQACSWWRVSRRMTALVKIILVISLLIVSSFVESH